MTQLEKAKEAFVERFDQAPTVIVQAPGRVNLIGEHTDYNDGFVLPCAINYQTLVLANPRPDDVIKIVAADYDETEEINLHSELLRSSERMWPNYIKGVVQELQKAGHKVQGADILVTGNVPQGAGLSSSASL